MPHAVARRMSRIYSSIVLIAMNSGEESDMSTFFALDLGLALVAKTCPYRPQAFKKVNNGQAFPYEENICFFIFSWTSRLQVLQGMSQKNSRKYSKTWLRRVNIASWLTPKVYPILKLSNFKASPKNGVDIARFTNLGRLCVNQPVAYQVHFFSKSTVGCYCTAGITAPRVSEEPQKTRLRGNIVMRTKNGV